MLVTVPDSTDGFPDPEFAKARRSRAAALAASLVIGAAAGVGSALWILDHGEFLGRDNVQGWVANHLVGSAKADPYTRAIIAKIGLLALTKEEAIYFHRYADDAGRRLRDDCAYEVRGAALPARWWSMTLYAEDEFLARNGDHAFSVDASRVSRDASGRWTAIVSPLREGAANWISNRGTGSFMLGLRLFNPDPRAIETPQDLTLPTIRRLSCAGGSQ